MSSPKTYRALETVYVDERYIREGELFTTAAPAGAQWELVEAAKLARTGKAAPAVADDE